MSDKPVVIGDPGPLGLTAFGLTTVILSLINAAVLPGAIMTVVLQLALVFGGSAQVLAGMWEFRKGNTFGATAFTSYGAFWISFYLLVNNIGSMKTDAGIGVGIYLLMWGVFTLYMFIGTFYINKALFFIFLFLLVTFILLALGNFSGSAGTTALGGWFGLITGILALYAAAAGIVNSVAGKTAWPVGGAFIKSNS